MTDSRLYIEDSSTTAERWVTPSEAADVLKVSTMTIRRAARSGRLVAVEVQPGLLRINLERLPPAHNTSRRRSA